MPKDSSVKVCGIICSSSTRILGRKRVAISPAPSPSGPHRRVRALRKQRSTRLHMDDAIGLLELLPQDVLVKVLCKVNHSNLRQLLLVSKPVSEATEVARELLPIKGNVFPDGLGARRVLLIIKCSLSVFHGSGFGGKLAKGTFRSL